MRVFAARASEGDRLLAILHRSHLVPVTCGSKQLAHPAMFKKLLSSPIIAGIRELLTTTPAGAKTVAVPRMRNMIWDIMDEARRKSTMHISFEVDATSIHAQCAKYTAEYGIPITLTTYLAKSLADAVAAEPAMHAYLRGRKELVMFDDVDLSIMLERKIEGARLPVPFILRRANTKGLVEIDAALKVARKKPLFVGGSPASAIDGQFFALPRPLRKIVWFFVRRSPRLFREVAGTVALTSLPWRSDGRGIGWGISPMTLTLVVGATSKQVKLVEGRAVEHEILQLHFSADHDVIDAAPLVRFIVRFKKRLAAGLGAADLEDAEGPEAQS